MRLPAALRRLFDPGPPRTVSLLRGAILGLACAVLWWPLTVHGAALLAGLAGLLGALAADVRAERPAPGPRLRTGGALLLALCSALGALAIAGAVVRWPGVAGWLGPTATLRLAEGILCLGISGPAVFALRLVAARQPLLAVAELAAVGSALIAAVASHREGMVHRPYLLGDLSWSRGVDPTLVFLALGGLGLLVLAALLLSEERLRRVPLHLCALPLVGLFLLLFVRLSGLPQPLPPSDLGLTGGGAGRSGGQPQSEAASELDDLEFKDEYQSDGKRAPVAVVLLHDDYAPPSGVYYFRQSVFSRYNGRRLVQTTGPDIDLDVVPHFPSGRFELPWRPPESEHRRSVRTTTGLLLDHVRPFALDAPVAIEARANEDGLRFQRTYEAESLVQTRPYETMLGLAGGQPDWSEEIRRHYTAAPDDARYAGLAEKTISVLRPEYRDDSLARALAVKLYLDENGSYSRLSHHADASDPTASFLFGDLTGYCVHFAHAAVYLLRSLGVPARVAAGYAVPEADRAGGSAIMIRALNAHAWPEVFLDGVGWVVVDITPARYLDPIAPRADPELQNLLGEMLRRGARPIPGLDPPGGDPISLAGLLRGLAGLVLALGAVAFGVKGYRALAPRLAAEAALPRIAYRAALDRLGEVGLSRRFGESRERFAARSAAVSASFGALTAVHLRHALGAGAAPSGEPRRLFAAMRGELRARVPLWRRALGLLDPFVWLRSR